MKKYILHGSDTYTTHKRAIVSGNVIEIYEYEKPILKNSKMKRNKGRSTEDSTDELTKVENRKKVGYRAKKTVQRYANANPHLDKFVTLTFKDNVTDIEVASALFNKFRTRITQEYENFEFIKVVEFQKRGAIHFHMLCNLPYIPNQRLQDIWGQGFTSIMKVDKIDNIGAYITKYMCKDFDDRLRGKRSFTKSHTLQPPVLIEDTAIVNDLEDDLGEVIRSYKQAFDSEHYGVIFYKQYVCKNSVLRKLERLVALERRTFDNLFEWNAFQDEFPF